MREEQLSEELHALFTEKMQDARRTIFVGSALVLLTLLYEGSRLRDLGFDVARLPIYVHLVPLAVYVFIINPIINYRRGARVIWQCQQDAANGSWHFETIRNESFVLTQPVAEAEQELRFRGKSYQAKTFSSNGQKLWLPLAVRA